MTLYSTALTTTTVYYCCLSGLQGEEDVFPGDSWRWCGSGCGAGTHLCGYMVISQETAGTTSPILHSVKQKYKPQENQ